LDDLDKRLERLMSLTASVQADVESAENPMESEDDAAFSDDFRDGSPAVVLPQQTTEQPHSIDRNVISDTLHVRHSSRLAEPRPGLVRAGRPIPRREPERQGIQDRRPGRTRMAAVVPEFEEF
jgi:hypothetical protein